jgi:hypothetical protein
VANIFSTASVIFSAEGSGLLISPVAVPRQTSDRLLASTTSMTSVPSLYSRMSVRRAA